MSYQCFQPGCPGTHASKYEVCERTSKQVSAQDFLSNVDLRELLRAIQTTPHNWAFGEQLIACLTELQQRRASTETRGAPDIVNELRGPDEAGYITASRAFAANEIKNLRAALARSPVTGLRRVTQEDWNSEVRRAEELEEALRAALPILEAHTPPLSTSGTMVSLCKRVRTALRLSAETERARVHVVYCDHDDPSWCTDECRKPKLDYR